VTGRSATFFIDDLPRRHYIKEGGAFAKVDGVNPPPPFEIPAMYESGSLVHEGGLMSYGANPDDNFRRAASYVDRIFKGATPNRLPVEQPTRYYLAINLKTARALGLTISPSLRLRADQVIE
jgi:ABC-type uncharacterized transport system substrate-binding protein